ncbi:flagellar basal-body MS-ring/collar protein FliF [Desulfobacterota bacterium M19]
MASPKEMLEQIWSIITELPPIQKIAGGLVLAAVVITLALIMGHDSGSGGNYGVLFSSLTESDAADIVAKLKEQNVPYKLAANGTAIKVPEDVVLNTRLTLAGEGLPRGGGVGFEIFDRSNLGVTDFVQKLNYQRALQGELARTIRQFQQISSARVHLALPRESVFVEDQRPPSASVSIKMRGRGKLTKSQIRAIVNLVACAVSGLTENNITVVDTAGHLLFRREGDEPGMLSSDQLEYKLKLESNMRRKLETMFEEVVGVGKVIARVSADVDFNQVNTTEELYDPDGQVVRSEQLSNESDKQNGGSAKGIPGVKGDLATFSGTSGGGSNSSGSSRNSVTRNYEISKTVKKTKDSVGTIKKITVALMVDGSYKMVKGPNGRMISKYVPRSKAELASFTRMAQKAVGLDPDRGDTIEVVSMPFFTSTAQEADTGGGSKWQQLVIRLAQPVMYLILAVCFILFAARPFFRLLSNKQLEEEKQAMLAASRLSTAGSQEGGEKEEDLTLPNKGMSDKEKIYKLAQSDPDRAADLVRRWLREGA